MDPRTAGRLARFWEAFRRQPLLNGFLAALCIAAIVLAILAIGPASESGAGQTTRTTTVKRGVVQSTVSGSGSIASASDLNLGFKTSGTVTHIYVKEGEEVAKGQLLATVDPQSAEVSLQQAEATLKSAEANLAQLEENEGESSSGSSSSPTASAASTEDASYIHDTTEAPAGSEPASTAPHDDHRAADDDNYDARHDNGTGTGTTQPTKTSTGTGSASNPKRLRNPPLNPPHPRKAAAKRPASKQSEATREANLASARATVQSDKLSVQSAENAVANTKLVAPESGTLVSLSGEVGETV